MKRSAWLGGSLCLLWGFFSVSCVQKEYVADDIDLTVNVGGDSLALPLGATDTIYARTLLDEAGDGATSFLKELADGTLAIRQDGGFGVDVPEVEAQRLTLPDFAGASVCALTFAAEAEAKAAGLTAPVADALPVSTGLEDVPAEVKRIDYVALAAGAELVFTFEVPALAQHPEVSMALDVLVDLPDYVRPAEPAVLENGQLRVRAPLDGGKLTQTVSLDGFDFSRFAIADGRMDIAGEMRYEGRVDLRSDDPAQLAAWDGRKVDLEAHYTVETLHPRRFEGLFEPAVDPIEETVTFGDLPDMLTEDGTVFDFSAPYLLLSIPTNLGIALENELTVTPVFGGTADTEKAAKARLNLPERPDAETDTVRFYLADERPAVLPDGHEFVACGLASVLYRIPDALRIRVETRAGQAAEMVYDFGADYAAAVNYDFIVPMAFGEDLHLSFGDTIDGLPNLVNEILSKNVLRLGGTVQNSLPMDLTLSVVALDDQGGEVPMETEPQVIRGGTPAGEAVSTPLALTLGDRTGASDTRPVKALALRFTMTTGTGNAGVPVKATSWVRAVLQAEVPGGITVDLGALGAGADESQTPESGR